MHEASALSVNKTPRPALDLNVNSDLPVCLRNSHLREMLLSLSGLDVV